MYIWTGRVVADALVEENRNMLGSTFTNTNGEYILKVPPVQHKGYTGWYNNIHVTKNGYSFYCSQSMYHTDDDIGRTFTVNFILYPDN